MIEIYIARQPIFDRRLDVVGYELLYRSGVANQAMVIDDDRATSQVILNTFAEIGLNNLVGNVKAYINAGRNFLVGKYPIPLPPSQVVIEVLEDVAIDAKLVEALRSLTQKGYVLALDDVVSYKNIAPLLGLASIIKIDLRDVDRSILPSLIYDLRQYPLRLLAEKVETQEELNYALRLGFDYFQGYFLCKPNMVKGRRLDHSRLVVLQSIALLQNPKSTFETVEGVVAQDVVLSYKLLKLINSAHFSLRAQVKSIRQAISLLGLNTLKGWMALLLMAGVDNKPHELTLIALQRAKIAEGLARALGESQGDIYFLVGLFSTLDAMMDLSMEQVVTSIPLTTEVVDALLTHQGKPGKILNAILAYEQGNYEPVNQLKINAEKMTEIYLDSIRWAQVLSAVTKETVQS